MSCPYCIEEPEEGKCVRGGCTSCCECGRPLMALPAQGLPPTQLGPGEFKKLLVEEWNWHLERFGFSLFYGDQALADRDLEKGESGDGPANFGQHCLDQEAEWDITSVEADEED